MLHIAMIDAGRTDEVHVAIVAIHSQARLILVCDPFIKAAKTLTGPLEVRTLADAVGAFSADDADTVVIGSPTSLHTEHILAAAHAGEATLYEKPAVSFVEVVHALADELATFEHPPMMVGFQYRYDSSIAKVQRLAAEGWVGRIEQLTIVPCGPASPSAEHLVQPEGVFENMTIHDFGGARFFLSEIVSVSVIEQKLNPALIDAGGFDGAVMILRAASGVAATTKGTRHCASGYDQKVEVFRSEGEVIVENLRATSAQVSDATGSAQQEVYLNFFLERYADVYHDELTAFIDAVNNGSPATPTVEGGVAVLVLAKAAKRSARSGQTVKMMR